MATVYLGGDGATCTRKEEVMANARLIAAAPDLLAALVDLLKLGSDLASEDKTEFESEPIVLAARAAIQKATQPA